MALDPNAKIFLGKLQKHLSRVISVADARKYTREGPFFKEQVVPSVHSFLRAQGYSREQARESLLAEGCQDPQISDLVCGTPSSKTGYPFTKGLSKALRNAKVKWWEDGKGLHPSCPDIAILNPYKIVFEGKLFRHGGLARAKTEIVHDVYECAFYRGLPTLFHGGHDLSSNYDYACLLAFDATQDQALICAWKLVDKDVKDSIWKDLGVHVMILPDEISIAS